MPQRLFGRATIFFLLQSSSTIPRNIPCEFQLSTRIFFLMAVLGSIFCVVPPERRTGANQSINKRVPRLNWNISYVYIFCILITSRSSSMKLCNGMTHNNHYRSDHVGYNIRRLASRAHSADGSASRQGPWIVVYTTRLPQ